MSDNAAAGPSSPEPVDHELRVDEPVAEYMRRVDAGENVDQASFVAAHPDAAAELQSFFEMTAVVQEIAGTAVQPGTDARASTMSQTLCNVETQTPAPKAGVSRLDSPLPSEFGRYRVLRTLGSGAM